MTEMHLATCVDPHSFYLSWHHFSWSRTTLSANFCRVKRSFKPYMNKHDSVKEAKAKANKHVTLTHILPWKSWFTTHLPLLSWNTFTHWNEAYYMLSKRKKWGKKKREKRDGEKVKGKNQNYCVTFKLKTKFYFLRIRPELQKLVLFWHLDQKAVRPTTHKQLFGLSFSSL